LRSGARPGDFLYVTGTLGSAAAALNQLRDGESLRPRLHPKHFYPQPRVAVGQFLREKKLASAMIDISDGLSTDLGHVCEESGTGAVVYAEALPVAGGKVGLTLALHGGDEYELLFTAGPERRIPKQIAGVPVTRIGEILSGKYMRLATADGKTQPLKPAGWEHFGG
jgi:thiamine-monophosphate kinase